EHMSLYRGWGSALNGQGEPELINGLRVNYDFFDTLGVRMQIGRTFLPEEDRPDRWHVLILSHGLWLRRFGGDPDVMGRAIRLNEATFTVRSEEHTSELQSRSDLVCRLLLEKKNEHVVTEQGDLLHQDVLRLHLQLQDGSDSLD